MYDLISPSIPTLTIFMDWEHTQESLCPRQRNSKLMMLTFAWRENNLGTHIRIRLFSFNLLLKTKEIRLRLTGNVIRDTGLVMSSTYGHYTHELCVHACAFDICHYRADDREA